MPSERWHRIKEIFHEVVALTPDERADFLNRACGSDGELRGDVEKLLAADAAASFHIENAIAAAVDSLPTETASTVERIGERIGRYAITGLIGKGGMGVVYRGVRLDDFHMDVAIKLLRRGTDTGTTLERFRSERQILAVLQHPNIARLIDGGATEDGLPYLVMEYVNGTPLLEYAAPLSVRERVSLFRCICQAVHYAHQHSVVHRDIKPANILVTREGVPKLLDFGIAKLADPQGDETLTATGMRLMTPGYASPEQIRGEPVGQATDVYSLGAVLYELLTGQRTHSLESRSAAELERQICYAEPKAPSALAKTVARDLDFVVLRALRKEPGRRYASALQLAEDLDRFLNHLPVRARGQSIVYGWRKFLRRNRGLLAAAALSAAVVIAGIEGTRRWRSAPPTVGRAGQTQDRRSTPLDWSDLTFENIASLGDAAVGGGTLTKFFEPWGLNDRGDVVFLSGLGPGRVGLYLWRGSAGQPPSCWRARAIRLRAAGSTIRI